MSRRIGKPLYDPATGKPMIDSVTGRPAFWMPRLLTPNNILSNVLLLQETWITNSDPSRFDVREVFYISPPDYMSGVLAGFFSVSFDAQINDEQAIDDGSGVFELSEDVLSSLTGDGNESCAIRVFQNGVELWQRDAFSFTGKTVTVFAPHKAGDSLLFSYIPESAIPNLDFQYPFSNASIYLNAPNARGFFYFGWNMSVDQTPKGGGYGHMSDGHQELGAFNTVLTADKGKPTERSVTIPCIEVILWGPVY